MISLPSIQFSDFPVTGKQICIVSPSLKNKEAHNLHLLHLKPQKTALQPTPPDL